MQENTAKFLHTQLKHVKILYDTLDSQYHWNFPAKIFCDHQGKIYIVDSGNHRVMIYDEQMNFLAQLGHWGKREGEFQKPWSIFVDNRGYIYVLDSGNERIQVFDYNLFFLRQFKIPKRTISFTVDDEGSIYLSCPTNEGLFLKLDSNGRVVKIFGEIITKDGENYFKNASHIYFDSKNVNLCTSFFFFPFISYYSKEGKLIKKFEIVSKSLQGINNLNTDEKGMRSYNINVWDLFVYEGEAYALIPHYSDLIPPTIYKCSITKDKITEYVPASDGIEYFQKPVSFCLSTKNEFVVSTADNRVIILKHSIHHGGIK